MIEWGFCISSVHSGGTGPNLWLRRKKRKKKREVQLFSEDFISV